MRVLLWFGLEINRWPFECTAMVLKKYHNRPIKYKHCRRTRFNAKIVCAGEKKTKNPFQTYSAELLLAVRFKSRRGRKKNARVVRRSRMCYTADLPRRDVRMLWCTRVTIKYLVRFVGWYIVILYCCEHRVGSHKRVSVYVTQYVWTTSPHYREYKICAPIILVRGKEIEILPSTRGVMTTIVANS